MITVRSTINLAHQSVPNIIPVVQGDTGRSILFSLADFTIPSGATARYFITKPSGLAVYNDATIDGNTVLVDLTAQSLAEYGDCPGQVRIMLGQTVVTSFEFILHVEPFRGIDAIESTTETNIFDKAVEDARDAIAEAAEEAEEYISQALDTTLTIPDKAADAKATGDAIWSILPTETAQGNPASFDDGADNVPVKDLKVSIVPHQDLHGYSKPWAGGAGKNLLNGDTVEIGTAWNGNINSDRARIVISAKPNTTYTLSMNGTNNMDLIVYGWYATTPALVRNVSFPQTFTTFGDTAYIVFGFNKTGITKNDFDALKLQLEVGSTATSYEPYENICPITGMTEVEVERTGKNLAISQSNNSVIGYAKKGKTYTVSYTPTSSNRGATIYKNNSSGATVATGAVPLTFTADEDFDIYFNGRTSNFTELQLEEGSTATAYEPHTEQDYTIPLDRTVYGGTLDVTTGVLTVDKVGYVFSGNEGFNLSSDGTAGRRFDIQLQTLGLPYGIQEGMSSHFVFYGSNTNVYGYYYNNREWLVFNDNGSHFASSDAFKAWLASEKSSGTPVQMCYTLATPLTYQLTPQELLSVLGTNHISTDAESVEVVYRQDIGLILKRMSDSLLPYLPLTRDGIYDLKAEVTGGEKSLYWWTQAISMMSSARPMQTPIADEPVEELEEVEEMTPEEDEED